MFLPNIDSLFFAVDIKNYNEDTKELIDKLDILQMKAKEERKNKSVLIGNYAFDLLPNGNRNYKFLLHNNRWEIRLAQFRNTNSSNFPVFIRLKSEFLWEKRDLAYKETIDFVEGGIGTVIAEKMSRADLCCHTDKVNVKKLKLDRFVTRSKSKEQIIDDIVDVSKMKKYYTNLVMTGLVFGKTPIRCRIYDKGLEIRQSSKKTWFYQIWKENGVDHDDVVNVEFQLNREFFKLFKIDTYEEFNNEIATIWRYLTVDWLRYVRKDKSRLEDCPTVKYWQELQKAYDQDWKSVNGIAREVQKSVNAKHLKNMIRHYMVSHAAAIGCKDFDNYKHNLEYDVLNLINEDGLTFEKAVENKMLMG
jgi:hypothetical protein